MINLTGSRFPWQGMGRGEGEREGERRERRKRAQKRAKESDSQEQESPERKTVFVSKVRCSAAGGRGAVLDPQDERGSGPTFSPTLRSRPRNLGVPSFGLTLKLYKVETGWTVSSLWPFCLNEQ